MVELVYTPVDEIEQVCLACCWFCRHLIYSSGRRSTLRFTPPGSLARRGTSSSGNTNSSSLPIYSRTTKSVSMKLQYMTLEGHSLNMTCAYRCKFPSIRVVLIHIQVLNTLSLSKKSSMFSTTSRNGPNPKMHRFLSCTLLPGLKFARSLKASCSFSCPSITP